MRFNSSLPLGILVLLSTFSIDAQTPEGEGGEWDDRFYVCIPSDDLSDRVNCLGFGLDGALLAGGKFVGFGLGDLTGALATYDGRRWSSYHGWMTNASFASEVLSVLPTDAGLFVGGIGIMGTGAVVLSNPTHWDGEAWHDLAGGVNGEIRAQAYHEGKLYVGGAFTQAGAVAVQNIACWDGEAWSALGEGVENRVWCLAIYQGNLVAGLRQNGDPDLSFGGLARWDGQTWTSIGAGVGGGDASDTAVKALAVNGDELYVGGHFREAGSQSITNLALWDGRQWRDLGGVSYRPSPVHRYLGVVYDLDWWNDKLVVGGAFERCGEVDASGLAFWDGSTWSLPLEDRISHPIDLVSDGQRLHVLGMRVDPVAGNHYYGLATYDAIGWKYYGQGHASVYSGAMESVAAMNTGVALTGDLKADFIYRAPEIAFWTGERWDWLWNGIPSASLDGGRLRVRGIAAQGDRIAASGAIPDGQGFALGVGYYEDAEWTYLPAPFSGHGWSSLAMAGERIYASSHTGRGVMFWNGSQWTPLGLDLDLFVTALCTQGDNVYAGGYIANPVTNKRVGQVARWNGTIWELVADEADGPIYCLAAQGRMIYAGGSFGSIHGVEAHGVAALENGSWSPLGEGLAGTEGQGNAVLGLTTDQQGVLYATGTFSQSGEQPIAGIARFRHGMWEALGEGINGRGNALAWWQGQLFVVGDFYRAGGKPSEKIAVWRDETSLLDIRVTGPHGIDPQGVFDVNLHLTPLGSGVTGPVTVSLPVPHGVQLLAASHEGKLQDGTLRWDLDGLGKQQPPLTCRFEHLTADDRILVPEATATVEEGEPYRADPYPITVRSLTAPPRIELTAPEAGTEFTAGAPITFTVDASAADTEIDRVEFYLNHEVLAVVENAPWFHTLPEAQPGPHLVQARAVDSVGHSTLSLPAEFTVISRPPNDLFENRIVVTGDHVELEQSMLNATPDPIEPQPLYGASIWWEYIAPSAGGLSMGVKELAERNLAISLYNGGSLAELELLGHVHHGSIPRLRVEPGERFVVRVACGFSVGGPVAEVTIDLTPPPVNDDFANRLLMEPAQGIAEVDNFGASAEKNEPSHRDAPANHSLWWSWSAPRDGHLVLDLPEDGRCELYQGDALANLTRLNPAVSGTSSIREYEVQAEVPYAIAIDSDERMAASFEWLFVPGEGQFREPTWTPQGKLRLEVLGVSGASYRLQRSINLKDWVSVTVLVPREGTASCEFHPNGESKTFFRLLPIRLD